MSILRTLLPLHAGRYPEMEIQDYVKLLYQSEFGPAHLHCTPEAILPALEEEFQTAQEEGYTPVYTVEAIGGGLCRFHLDPRQLAAEDLPLLGRCLTRSAVRQGSRTGLWKKLGELAGLVWAGQLPLRPEDTELFLQLYACRDCPCVHHSDAYTSAHRPHYRVLDRDLAAYFPALQAIDAALRATEGPVLVAVDGRCGSGKSSFARRAAQLFPCHVFHMDDFFLPPEKRTPERLAAPGGNVDYERAAQEIFAPLCRGEAVTFQPFDCAAGELRSPVTVPFRRLNIIEGSYSLHPALSGYSQLHLFFTCSSQVQLSRLARRETAESFQQFTQRWIPLEEAYFRGFSIENQCDMVIDTSRLPDCS